jgi:hypothetical protein
MMVDQVMILASYIISCAALLLSLFVLYTISEQEKPTKPTKQDNAWDHYHTKAKEKPKTTSKVSWK